MSKGLDFLLDFNEFVNLRPLPIHQSDYTIISTADKKISPSPKFIFKTFKFDCITSREQKIILQTFSQICSLKCQYLRCYKHFSFFFQGKYHPTFSMKFISTSTLSTILQYSKVKEKWTKYNMLSCLFAVAEGLSFLHDHLIYHGNLCPSNIIIDQSNQCYVIDFGLYPIKEIYINQLGICNSVYKDPSMGNNEPNFKNDVYSYGILMSHLCLVFYEPEMTLHEFIERSDESKYNSFPNVFTHLIKSCLSSYKTRPTFKQILKTFQDSEFKETYEKFISSNYIFNLAQAGDPFALNKLGEMFEDGKGIEMDHTKALLCFEKAALLNNSEAQSNFGVLLQDSGKEMKKGAKYLKLSADQGNIHGMANYGIALKLGDGVEPNRNKALEYLKKSADLGYAYAQVNYGKTLLEGRPSNKNIKEGLKYIKMSMDQNFPDSFFTYGKLLWSGEVVDKDKKLALSFYKKAADMNHSDAMFEYAKYIYNGIEIQKNQEIGLKYFNMAANNGNQDAVKFLNSDKSVLTQLIDDQLSNKTKKSTKSSKNRIVLEDANGEREIVSVSTSSNATSDDDESDDLEDSGDDNDDDSDVATKLSSKKSTKSKSKSKSKSKPPSPSKKSSKSISSLDIPIQTPTNVDLNKSEPIQIENNQTQPQIKDQTQTQNQFVNQSSSSKEPISQQSNKTTLNSPLNQNEPFPFDSNTPPDRLIQMFKEMENEYKSQVKNINNSNQDILQFPIFKYEEAFINTKNPQIIYQYGKFYENIDFKKCNEYIRIAAELGDAAAQNDYGCALQSGPGGKKKAANVIDGFKYLKKSADQGHITGLFNCGLAIFNGDGTKKDEELGLKYIKESADKGDLLAQLQYGKLCKDPVIGHQYIENLCKTNYPDAYLQNALDLIQGRGVDINLNKAAEILQNLYDAEEEPEVLAELVRCFSLFDYKKYIFYLRKLADLEEENFEDKDIKKEISNARYYIGIELIKGINLTKNVEEGYNYLKKSNLMTELRKYFPDIYAQIPHDFSSVKRKVDAFLRRNKQAVDPTEEAIINGAYNGDADDTFKAAQMFQKAGEFLTANFFYEVAADSNQKDACYILGKFYLKGKNKLKTSYTKGFKYLCQAADLGEMNAKYKVFDLHIKQKNKKVKYHRIDELVNEMAQLANEGNIKAAMLEAKYCIVNNSFEDAIRYLDFAAQNSSNNPKVQYRIAKLLIKIPDKFDEGLHMLEQIAANKPNASYFLGKYYYEKSDKTLDDLQKAELYLTRSVEHKIKDSQRILTLCKKEISKINKKLHNNNETNSPTVVQPSTVPPSNTEVKEAIKKETNEAKIEDQFIDLDLPTEELIKKGNEFYSKGNTMDAFQCYEAAAIRGDPVGYYGCAKITPDFNNKLEYFQNAIVNNVEGAFRDWRKCIATHVNQHRGKDVCLKYAKLFEEYKDYSDAALLYKKLKDEEKFQSCYAKALENIQNIQDGEQQYDFGNLLLEQGETESAVTMFKKSAENGIHRAEKKIRELSQNRLRQLKDLNKVDSLLEQGILYFEGKNGTTINVNKAINYFEEASKIGCPKADYYIGTYYRKGYGYNKITNDTNCAQFYKKAADQGDSDGQNGYGDCLKYGIGVDINLDLAIYYYHLAASQGNGMAEFNFGRTVYENSSDEEMKKNAISYLKKAAEKQIPDAMFYYSKAIKNINPKESEEYLNKSIQQCSELAIKEYGKELKEEGNFIKAAELYKNAALKKMKIGYRKYAKLIKNGLALENDQDDEIAKEYFEKAAQFGDPKDQFNYAEFLFNQEEAVNERAQYFKKAAEQEYVKAYFRYAECLEKGEGVKKNLSEAKKYYTLSYLNDPASPVNIIIDRLKEQGLIEC